MAVLFLIFMTIFETVEVKPVDASAVDTVISEQDRKKQRVTEPEPEKAECKTIEEAGEDRSDDSGEGIHNIDVHGMVIVPMSEQVAQADEGGESTGSTPDSISQSEHQDDGEVAPLAELADGNSNEVAVIEIDDNDDEEVQESTPSESVRGSSAKNVNSVEDI